MRNRRASSPSGGPPPWLINPVSAAMRTARAGSSSAASSVGAAQRRSRAAERRRAPESAAERIAGCGAFAAADQRVQRACVRIVRQVADRVGLDQRSLRAASAAIAISRSSASGRPARPPVNASARATSFARRPFGHHFASASTAHDGFLSVWHSLQALGIANRTVFSGAGRLIE